MTQESTSPVRKSVERSRSSSPVPSPGSWNIDRGRSRIRPTSRPVEPPPAPKRKGYHAVFTSFGHNSTKIFLLEKRWKLIREMGAGAYGYVISASDSISGEAVAIKLVTRVFDKISLAKRALREITLLRHFANHENITGLIDVDAISPDFNDIYIFMEPMEADLHQIIRSGQGLSSEHVQYFLYQILRGMKYVHSAGVVHRDLKPGNLLVNADCELKICDFGLSRGFVSKADEVASHMTEYVATRWYRAPEIMMAFNRYGTAVDVWAIGCILAELLLGKPLFKGKDYVDQLNKIFDVMGTPDEEVVRRVGSEKAQAYVRTLPIKRKVPLRRILPMADVQALDLLGKMLTFDPDKRITVVEALEHPWLAAYHDVDDEPACAEPFDKWRMIEKLETIEDFREALWREIVEYRNEVRGIVPEEEDEAVAAVEIIPTVIPPIPEAPVETDKGSNMLTPTPSYYFSAAPPMEFPRAMSRGDSIGSIGRADIVPTDPVVSYSRRSSFFGPQSARRPSVYQRPNGMPVTPEMPTFQESPKLGHVEITPNGVVFPTTSQYVIPARSRTMSTATGDVFARKLLRTLSTVSIHESIDGLPGGLDGVGSIAKYLLDAQPREGSTPEGSDSPNEFGIVTKKPATIIEDQVAS